MFVSKRTGKRLTARRVQQIVERCLQSAGLSGRGYSPHKLRHTAATLMYQNGVDMLALKEIIGHQLSLNRASFTVCSFSWKVSTHQVLKEATGMVCLFDA